MDAITVESGDKAYSHTVLVLFTSNEEMVRCQMRGDEFYPGLQPSLQPV